MKHCEFCGKKLIITSHHKKRKFCNYSCYWHSLKGRIPNSVILKGKSKIICLICKKEFMDYYSNKRKFCSKKCKSISMIGKIPKNVFKKGQVKGEKNGHWKGGLPKCIDCGKTLRKYNVLRHRKCYLKFNKQENHWHWKGGSSSELYPPTFNQQLKDKIRVRDNFICQVCGVPELECWRRLDVHHIDYGKENCNEDNLISLCIGCNSKVNVNREYWKRYFQNKMEEKNEYIARKETNI